MEQLLPLAAHVAAALQYMANEGWVHLDVKPDNIVMGVPPRLRADGLCLFTWWRCPLPPQALPKDPDL